MSLIHILGAGHVHIKYSFRLRNSLQFYKISALDAHTSKDTTFSTYEVVRCIKLRNPSLIEDDQTVVINDGPQAMGNLINRQT